MMSFRHVVVDEDNPPDPHCKAAGDIDGDGRPDLLAASASGGGLFWYRAPDWRKCKIADGTFTTDMAVADIDGDGCLDVVIPERAGMLVFRNPRGRGGDPAVDPWEVVNVSPEGAGMHDVEVCDLDGDGRLDILTRHQSGFGKRMGNQVHLWLQRSLGEWAHRAFDCPHGEGLAVADINGNGRPDVVIGGRWYQNPGDPLAGEWREHLFMEAEHFDTHWTNGDVMVAVADLNGDGRPEIVLSPSEGKGRLSWFQPPADPRQPDWAEHVLDPDLDHAHGLALADVDSDGRPDILVAKMHQASAPQEVCAYLNRGATWEKQVLATTGSHNIVAVEIGRKGHASLFGANWNNRASTHGALELWVNETGSDW